jgi:nucleolar MIF4G domain-containing protein 1
VEKRASHTRSTKAARDQHFYHQSSSQDRAKAVNKTPKQTSPHSSPEFSDANSDISVDDAGDPQADEADVYAPKVGQQEKHSGKVKRKLDEDDATIAALERKLGIKSDSRLPKSFADDGLLDILEGIDGDQASVGTRRGALDIGQQWLAGKRQRALQEDSGNQESESEFSGFDESEDDRPSQSPHKIGSIYRAVSESDKDKHASSKTPALPTKDDTSLSARLVEGEAAQRLRRIVRGLFNRLSEPNLLSLLSEIESLFQGNPRQLLFNIFLDNVLDHTGGPDVLSETFLILHAGFIAAVYKIVGSDFGAEAIQRICESLERDLDSRDTDSQSEKKAVNLITILTHLFTLQVISSELIYDFIRKFVGTISENNTQLLLRIVKCESWCISYKKEANGSTLCSIWPAAPSRGPIVA